MACNCLGLWFMSWLVLGSQTTPVSHFCLYCCPYSRQTNGLSKEPDKEQNGCFL